MAGERILLILMIPTDTRVVITRSKWVITLMIDLKPYNDLLERLASEIEKVSVIRNEIATYYYSDRYCGIMYSLRHKR